MLGYCSSGRDTSEIIPIITIPTAIIAEVTGRSMNVLMLMFSFLLLMNECSSAKVRSDSVVNLNCYRILFQYPVLSGIIPLFFTDFPVSAVRKNMKQLLLRQ